MVGPITHSVSDLRFFIQTILEAEPWLSDPKCIELPWREEEVKAVSGRPLALGLIKWDTIVKPHPPIQRGTRMVEEALKAQGHNVIDFAIPDARKVNGITVFITILPLQ